MNNFSTIEFLNRPPSWLVRIGTYLALFIISFILLLSVIIDYPETITSEVTVTTDIPYVPIKSKYDGKVISIDVNDGQFINSGKSIFSVEYKNELIKIDDVLKQGDFIQSIKAPLPCKVVFNKKINVGELISKNENIFYCLPIKNDFIAKMYVSLNSLNKLKLNQEVRIELDSYPSNEYGILIGKIKSISPFPVNEKYEVLISVPQDLKTSNGQKIKYRLDLIGTGNIVVKDKNFLEHTFGIK